MFPIISTNIQQVTCFEHLPDEILLYMCRYLSHIHILDSLLNLNSRINHTISSYRERICVSHLSNSEFVRLVTEHLPRLAPNVSRLFINNRSMMGAGKKFEEHFNKIDQQFPALRELIFHQIDIETLENLSWRFNTMRCLTHLDIDIAGDRLSSMPVQFDEFICGKLFSQSNSLLSVKLQLQKYAFNLQSITRTCDNMRQLTISVRSLSDLFLIFERFPNIEKLDVTIGGKFFSNVDYDIFSYTHLWWKIPYLTHFNLTIDEQELMSHEHIISQSTISEIIVNMHSLLNFKFVLRLAFHKNLQLITTKEIYMDKYFPYANGTLWEQALKRNDQRIVQFRLHIQIGEIPSNSLIQKSQSHMMNFERMNGIDFNPLIRTTFSSAYWLQQNLTVQYISSAMGHVLIYTVPLTELHLSTTIDMVYQELLISSWQHEYVQNLIIHSNENHYNLNLSLANLFHRFPSLTNLELNAVLLLPPNMSVCSMRLRSISLSDYSLISCCQLLEFLPGVISLSITSMHSRLFACDSHSKPGRSITRLKVSTDFIDLKKFLKINEQFPNVKEFCLLAKTSYDLPTDELQQNEFFECSLNKFTHLQYFELTVPIKQWSHTPFNWRHLLSTKQPLYTITRDGGSLFLKVWYE